MHIKRYSTPLTDIPVHTWSICRKSPQTDAGESEPHRLLIEHELVQPLWKHVLEEGVYVCVCICIMYVRAHLGKVLRLTSGLPGLHTTFCVEAGSLMAPRTHYLTSSRCLNSVFHQWGSCCTLPAFTWLLGIWVPVLTFAH